MAKPGPAAGFQHIAHPKKRALLLAYSETMRLRLSCASAGISPRMHQYWLVEDPSYASAFEEARTMGAETLQDEAIRRALDADKPSDILLIFLLKGHFKARYAERTEHTGTAGGPVQIADMSEELLDARLAVLLARMNGQASALVNETGSLS